VTDLQAPAPRGMYRVQYDVTEVTADKKPVCHRFVDLDDPELDAVERRGWAGQAIISRVLPEGEVVLAHLHATPSQARDLMRMAEAGREPSL